MSLFILAKPVPFHPQKFLFALLLWRLARSIVGDVLSTRLVICFAISLSAACASNRVLVVDVISVVHPVTTEIVSAALSQADAQNAALVVLRLNTPGGLMDAMRDTIQKIVASRVPVVTYVSPSGGRAASAGFFLLEAGDVAAMAPGTNTGAAHPVSMGSQMDPIMKQKVENDAAAALRSLTGKRNRNPELAEKAVLESRSFTDTEARDAHLIEIIAADLPDLLRQLDGREIQRFNGTRQTLRLTGAATDKYQESLRQRIMSALADPNLALILLIVGAFGIYVEFTSPGVIFPGVAGAISVLLGLAALSVLPINGLGAALLFISFVLLFMEVKFHAHGALALTGAAAMAFGAVLLVDGPIPELRVRWITAIGVTLPFVAITTLLVTLAVRARGNKAVTGAAGMIGQIGTAVEDVNPLGRVLVRGEYWNAQSPAAVTAGMKVRVRAVDHLTLLVEPVAN